MNDLLNNIEEIRSFIASKQRSDDLFDDRGKNNSNGPTAYRLKHANSFQQPPTTKKPGPFPIRKVSIEYEIPSNPGFVYQITLGYILKFIEFLHKKFIKELDFHIEHAQEISSLQKDVPASNPELETIKHMIHFDCFTIINKKYNINYLKIENILERLKLMNKVLKETEAFIKASNTSRILVFFTESECRKCFFKNFPESLFQNEYFSKICSELWRFMRQVQHDEPTETNTQVPFENLKLFLYGISFPTPYIEDFPLHQAVYTANLPLIRRICARENSSPTFYSHVEQCDPAGVTALMLAVSLGNKDAALILTNHGADPKHRSYPYARTPLEEAIQKKA